MGKTIEARFLNGLPGRASPWYSRPAGVVQGRGGEYFLSGTQNSRQACSAAQDDNGGDKKKNGQG